MSVDDNNPSSWLLVTVIVLIVVTIFFVWQFFLSDTTRENKVEPVQEVVNAETTIDSIEDVFIQDADSLVTTPKDSTSDIVDIIEEPKSSAKPLVNTPVLDDSDSWVKENLTSIIWRKELLALLIDEDIVRRFVVFVDNFSQGNVAYSHSPFIKPITKLSVKNVPTDDQESLWELDDKSFKRFSLYVDLFRSVDSEILVEWYQELKPLITEAYAELGYPERNFDQTLQSAITKVLDIEFPKGNNQLVRPSVMFRYKSAEIESLDDADKLMLRIGKDNLLIIKSVLLEVNEKLLKR